MTFRDLRVLLKAVGTRENLLVSMIDLRHDKGQDVPLLIKLLTEAAKLAKHNGRVGGDDERTASRTRPRASSRPTSPTRGARRRATPGASGARRSRRRTRFQQNSCLHVAYTRPKIKVWEPLVKFQLR